LDEDGETINSTDDEFVQPSDEYAQGNVLTDEELARKRMSDIHRTPSKEDSKPAAQPEKEDSSPPPEQHRERPSKRDLEYRKQTLVEMKITNDLTLHTVVITTETNVHEMIADDHPQEIAPTPTRSVRAAQVITSEMVQHSTMTKRNIRSSTNT
jgi:hypothetical protein